MNPSFKQILIKSFQFDGGKEREGREKKVQREGERERESD